MKRMGFWALCWLFVLCILSGCGGSNGDDPIGPADEQRSAVTDEALAVTNVLVQSFQNAFFASLTADTTAIAGFEGRGQVRIEGRTWTMEEYSPDGVLFLNGVLDVDKSLYPNIPVGGTINLTGAQESVLVLDIVVIVRGTDLTATGKISMDDVVYDMAGLIAASE